MILIKCKNCKHCKYIYFDGYVCTKFNSHLPEKLIDEDIDCMVKEYESMMTIIHIDEDGCKNVKAIFLETIEF